MATLQKIRSKGPLLLIVIGLAMLAFILGDAWKIIRPNQGVQYVGSIDGENISAMDFQHELEVYTDVVKFANQVSDLSELQQNQIKDEVWSTMVRDRILNKETQALGLQVTDAELMEVIEHGNDQMLQNTPFNNEEGKFDADILKSFLAFYEELDRDALSAEEYNYYQGMYNYWLFIEQSIRTNLLYTKYQALVNGAIVSNPVSAKNAFENRIKRTDVLIASLPYSTVADTDVKLTSADVKAVYNEGKEGLYNYSETRDIVYIDYEIVPSEADREALAVEMNEVASQLESDVDDYAAFLRRAGSDVTFSEVARQAKNLPEDVTLRLDSVKVGDVFGPYYNADDDTYNAFKYLSTVNGYDSIQVKLMQVVMDDEAAAAKRVDSIMTALKKGANFDAIAESYDQSAPEQWLAADSYEPAVVEGDNAAYLNKANSMKKGEVASLKVEFGTIIIKVLDTKTPVKKYNLAIVKHPVEFSEETSNNAYNKLSAFLATNTTVEEMRENAEDSDFRLLYYPGFQNYNYNIGGVAKSHEALRWAFEAQAGEVSRIYEVGDFNDHLLAVGVEKIHPRGYTSLEDATPTLTLRALNNKKFDMLKDKLAGKSFDELKNVDGVVIDTVKFVNFNNPAYIASSFSNEAALGASVMNLEQDEVTAPIKGEGCAYVAKKVSADSYSAEFDAKSEGLRLRSMNSQQIGSQLLEALFYEANVVDNRYKVF
ncbi:MAG: SurA N-terminal domain-containing protein [Bacteroidaceae bacterium]|nr:SurA N-terminal domain-containing protein [Bacteroidaceae bacterium]